MSTIEGKLWYRNTFLQSEEWKTFRIQMLANADAKCFVCDLKDVSNDVHHVWYGEPSCTGARQFVILCRECHEEIHDKCMFEKATAENEKHDAWKRMNVMRLVLRSTDRVIKSIKTAKIAAQQPKSCRGCNTPVTDTFWANPVRQIITESKGIGSMRLCAVCFQKIREVFPQDENAKGTKKQWLAVMQFLDRLKAESIAAEQSDADAVFKTTRIPWLEWP
jgi:hypothetical protein